jgi:signal transduction histidine kinase
VKAPLLTIDIRYEQDVVLCRQRARQVAALLGLGPTDQTAFATAVSEVARNAFNYAGGGRADFWVEGDGSNNVASPALVARVRDRGPGIPNLEEILDGRYRSRTGMGLGLVGSRRLSDRFEIEAGAGTSVVLGKYLPRYADVRPETLAAVAAELARRQPQGPLEEVRQQNKELIGALEELGNRQTEVSRLQAELERTNAELAETNRGVLALYAELDEKAESLRKASEVKSRFLSDMSHELRTPLNAMVSISGLLLDRTDGELTDEQEKQVRFIRESAESLSQMVNDLLDLAKIEAGKVDVHPSDFNVAELLSALRGMFRPLFRAGAVALVVEEPRGVETMCTDEPKLSQILRNLVSNAMKFTERGEVRVAAAANGDGTVTFSVSDTGIGIAPQDRERIFEDFAQVEGPAQRRAKGTGLGLPLTRKLARLLGGDVTVQSQPGVGSTFSVTLPIECPGAPPATSSGAATSGAATSGAATSGAATADADSGEVMAEGRRHG